MRGVGRGRRITAAVVTAMLVVAGCDSAPTSAPSGASTAGPTRAASPTASETPLATPLVTVAPPPTQPIAVGPWQPVALKDSVSASQFLDVVWTGTRFVAVGFAQDGGGTFLTSTDGQAWKSATSGEGSGPPSDIAAGPNGIVAIGTLAEKTAAWFSADGVHWEYRLKVFPKALGADDLVTVTDVVAMPAGWLAVGRDDPFCQVSCGSTPRRAVAWTSSDAKSWTRIPAQASLSKAGMNAVTAVDGGFVAVGDAAGHAAIWTSTDGLAWTRVSDAPMFAPPSGADPAATVSAVGVAAASGSIVAVGMALGAGDGGAPVVMAWRSTDGHTWTPTTVEGAEEGQVFSVAATSTGFLATGPSGETSCLGGIWSSPDGATWVCEATDPAFKGFGPYAAASSSSVEIAVGLTDVGWDENSGVGQPGAVWWRPVE